MNLLNERDVTNAFRKKKKQPQRKPRHAPNHRPPRPPRVPTTNSDAARSQNTSLDQWAGGGAGRGAGGSWKIRTERPLGRAARRRPIRARGLPVPPAHPPPGASPPPPPPPPGVGAARGGGRAPGRQGRPRHVGEHGGAAAPGDDQPVRAGGRVRRRPGQAAAAGGPLAVRDGPERLLPGDQHSQQPPPPPDDVHPQQHAGHAAQLPGRPGHVLQAADLREPAEQQQPHRLHGLLPAGELQPLLGLLAPQPPACLAAPLLAHRPRPPPPPAPPAARLAPHPATCRPTTESRGHHGRPEIRLGGWRGGTGEGGGVCTRALGVGAPPKTHWNNFLGFIIIFRRGEGGRQAAREAPAHNNLWKSCYPVFSPPIFFF